VAAAHTADGDGFFERSYVGAGWGGSTHGW
jgi:hypothetical protein